MTVLMCVDIADDRWSSDAPLRAALTHTMLTVYSDERRKKMRFPSARTDLTDLLEEYGDEALKEIEDIMRVLRSAYAEMVVARHKAKGALNEVFRRRSSSRDDA